MKIINFLKKNWKYILGLLVVILIIGYTVIRELRIVAVAEEKLKLELRINELETQRDQIIAENSNLIKENKQITHEKDSIIVMKDRLEKDMQVLKKKHKHQIDSLLNIPDDTVFVRLQPIFPNYDGDPLKYPFSGSQIRQIYTTAISYPMIQQEYGLQAKQLLTCNSLNKKYEESEVNYKAQVENLNKQIGNCDTQLGIKDTQIKKSQKQLNRKTFWNWTQKGGLVIIATLFILK